MTTFNSLLAFSVECYWAEPDRDDGARFDEAKLGEEKDRQMIAEKGQL